jgi:hypothetical protein
VNGASPNTTFVYATSSFPPPPGTPAQLIPIDTSKTPPVAGTAITLPDTPNSIMFDPSGAHAFIGTHSGLAVLDTATNTVTLTTPVPIGKVLAVSNDGNLVLISNAALDPGTGQPIDPFPSEQRLWLLNQSANNITTFIAPGVVAASFDADSFRAYAVGNGDTNNANAGNVVVFSPLLTLIKQNVPGLNKDVTSLASGPFAYEVNSSGLVPIATCNNAQQPAVPTNTTNLQFVSSVKNSNTIVAMEATGLDVETVTVSAGLTPPITPTSCVPNASYSNLFINFGLGPITAHQLLVASNGSHFAVLPVGLNRVVSAVLGAAPTSVFLAGGGTEPLSGGMTLDGTTLWVGVAGTNTVDRINLVSNADELQIPMSFKKIDGSPAPPNIVGLKPK